jgi:hypothetical protein
MSRLWTSEVWPVKDERQQNYRTIDQGVTSNGRSQSADDRLVFRKNSNYSRDTGASNKDLATIIVAPVK